jgi:hypothetical protein
MMCQVYNELSEEPVEEEFSSALTPSELADNQKLQTLDMQYYRVPLQYDTTPTEQVIRHSYHLGFESLRAKACTIL